MVSIRAAPARARRRDVGSLRGDQFHGFQSAPRPRGRGDAIGQCGCCGFMCFNPRRARAGAATQTVLTRVITEDVSIRAAPARARRHPLTGGPFTPGPVSIRAAPARARRRTVDEVGNRAADVSIRAAPARARRRTPFHDGAQIARVSIRAAPARARRRSAPLVTDILKDVSIRAAPARARRLA